MHQARRNQLIDQFFPQAFDIHRPPAGKMDQGLLALRRADQATGSFQLGKADFQERLIQWTPEAIRWSED